MLQYRPSQVTCCDVLSVTVLCQVTGISANLVVSLDRVSIDWILIKSPSGIYSFLNAALPGDAQRSWKIQCFLQADISNLLFGSSCNELQRRPSTESIRMTKCTRVLWRYTQRNRAIIFLQYQTVYNQDTKSKLSLLLVVFYFVFLLLNLFCIDHHQWSIRSAELLSAAYHGIDPDPAGKVDNLKWWVSVSVSVGFICGFGAE